MTEQKRVRELESGQDGVRLVACGRTADGRVLPLDDDSWDQGITEEEARTLGDHPATLSPMAYEPGTFAYRICQIVPKLRAAFPTQKERAQIWLCQDTGQAIKVSNVSDEEFDYDPEDEYGEGRCPCGAPLRKQSFVSAELADALAEAVERLLAWSVPVSSFGHEHFLATRSALTTYRQATPRSMCACGAGCWDGACTAQEIGE